MHFSVRQVSQMNELLNRNGSTPYWMLIVVVLSECLVTITLNCIDRFTVLVVATVREGDSVHFWNESTVYSTLHLLYRYRAIQKRIKDWLKQGLFLISAMCNVLGAIFPFIMERNSDRFLHSSPYDTRLQLTPRTNLEIHYFLQYQRKWSSIEDLLHHVIYIYTTNIRSHVFVIPKFPKSDLRAEKEDGRPEAQRRQEYVYWIKLNDHLLRTQNKVKPHTLTRAQHATTTKEFIHKQ